MEIRPQQGYKSIAVFPTLAMPDFVVVTGENGSGKTQLLEAIHNQSILGSWEGSQQDIRFVTTDQLGAPQEFSGGDESRESQISRFESTVRQIDQLRGRSPYDTSEGVREGLRNLLRPLGITDAGFDLLEDRAGKPIGDWSHDDFARHTPLEFGVIDPFAVRVGDLFSRYSQMLAANNYNRFMASEGHQVEFREPAEFESEFGLPPWELFNLALERVGLPYRFQAPSPPSLMPMTDPPVLLDPGTGLGLKVSMLSTGERALLSVAMSVYSTTHRTALMPMPRIVLLDEPDATLHPSMIRSLLSLLMDEFVERLGICVVLTTHSPTTVALAPEASIFVMQRTANPRLQQALSKDAALSHLLVGVPTLSVSSENRRVVIVESPRDAERYTAIGGILSNSIGSERSLVFMAAGGGGLADGSATVIDLVSRLRANGNVQVWGLVDRDDRAEEPHPQVFMNGERYTVENIVLDPLSIGLLLLAEANKRTLESMSLVNFVSFDPVVDAQQLVDFVVANVVQAADDDAARVVHYRGGVSVSIPAFWLDSSGKQLTPRLFAAFPELQAFRDSDRLMASVVAKVWASRPGVIPQSVQAVFERLLS